ncbi:hypothetical protein [Gloeocapsopsis crepidinum]|uniref:hypothetical protein n=1 Tax=Gloeocapsopsis crepidinum TaxID=693223 RepID=UPI001D13DD3C|nr:hypothetical protein [Gloeocapsopsis crepidinum]
MARIYDTFIAGDPVMFPLLGLSIVTFACAFERAWFWFQLLSKEDRIVHDVLAAARLDLAKAANIAQKAQCFTNWSFFICAFKVNSAYS